MTSAAATPPPIPALGAIPDAEAQHDVATLEQARAALRASERRYQALVEAVADVVWTTDALGQVADMPAWRALTGQSVEEVRGDGWLMAVHPDDRGATREAWRRALAARGRFQHEVRVRQADGSHRRMRACAMPVVDDHGAVREWVCTLVDMEALRRVEDALHAARRESEAYAEDAARMATAERHARREAEAANRAKSEFLGMMSHELRTPLNAITGYVDILDMELHGPVTALQRDDLQRVRRGAQVLLALVNDVLSFARLEAGQVELTTMAVPLATLLRELEELLLPQLAAKGLTHGFTASDASLTVHADPERLKQILLNLLTNAVKFTPEGGTVTVTCERAGDRVLVHVRDTGRGIPPEALERIFEPFVQVDRHLTRESQQGIGLGLAISRDLARRMDGDLTVRSTPGAGAVFTLSVPVKG